MNSKTPPFPETAKITRHEENENERYELQEGDLPGYFADYIRYAYSKWFPVGNNKALWHLWGNYCYVVALDEGSIRDELVARLLFSPLQPWSRNR